MFINDRRDFVYHLILICKKSIWQTNLIKKCLNIKYFLFNPLTLNVPFHFKFKSYNHKYKPLTSKYIISTTPKRNKKIKATSMFYRPDEKE